MRNKGNKLEKLLRNNNMKRNYVLLGLLIIITLMFSSCVEIVDVGKCLPVDGEVYGFWDGLWHGLISGIAFIGSLFNDEIGIYAINNNGAWYNIGFLMGVGSTLGSGISYSVKKTKKKRIKYNNYN